MADVRLFEITGSAPRELQGKTVEIEKEVQALIEKNLEAFFAVRFLATEYSTGKTHSGRIDSLGLDENNSPVILEYKRRADENVITQGLYYLDWLMDHKSEFDILANDVLGDIEVDWSAPRLICVAGDYKKFDLHATNQINRNIDLVRYELYEKSHILFELINSAEANSKKPEVKTTTKASEEKASDQVEKAPEKTKALWRDLEDFIFSLGDDISVFDLRYYVAFRTIKNFACAVVRPQKSVIQIVLPLDPASNILDDGFTRDISGVGHWGTGDLQIEIKNKNDLERSKSFIKKSYEGVN